MVNGFDGALTMLGLIIAFHLADTDNLDLVIKACVGAAIALGISGSTSAYLSEAAERRRALNELEDAMVADLSHSAHGSATRVVPWVVAFVNGAAPLLISLFILVPVFLAQIGITFPLAPMPSAIALGFVSIFGLGIFLGRVAGTSWWWSGIKTLVIAFATAALIFIISG